MYGRWSFCEKKMELCWREGKFLPGVQERLVREQKRRI